MDRVRKFLLDSFVKEEDIFLYDIGKKYGLELRNIEPSVKIFKNKTLKRRYTLFFNYSSYLEDILNDLLKLNVINQESFGVIFLFFESFSDKNNKNFYIGLDGNEKNIKFYVEDVFNNIMYCKIVKNNKIKDKSYFLLSDKNDIKQIFNKIKKFIPDFNDLEKISKIYKVADNNIEFNYHLILANNTIFKQSPYFVRVLGVTENSYTLYFRFDCVL